METGKTRIGWIGFGKMGRPICLRLKQAGFPVVVFCRSAGAEKAAAADGFPVSRTIAETIKGAEIVASAISDDRALLDIVLGAGGLKDSLSAGQIYVDTSTVSPQASARVAEALAPNAAPYFRAPVSGSTATAAQGALTAMVSGPAAAFGDLAAFFGAFTKKAFLVGAAEEARYLKLAINAMVGATSALMGEALALARKGGLDTGAIMDVVVESAVASPLVQYKRAAVVSGDYAPAFSASQMLKDFDLIADAADATSCDMPLIASIRNLYRETVAQGRGDQDFFVLTAENTSRE